MMTDWYAVWHTHNAGRNWTPGVPGYETTCVFHLLPDPARGNVIHAIVADKGYPCSTNGGKSFRRDVKGITDQVRDVDLSPAAPDSGYAVGSVPATEGGWYVNQLFLSRDIGQTWDCSPMAGLPAFGTNRFCASVTAGPDLAGVVYLGVNGPAGPSDGGGWTGTVGARQHAALPAEHVKVGTSGGVFVHRPAEAR